MSPYIGTISNSHIINSLDLVSKLSTLNVNYNYKLVSFDVKSLFTNVPVDSLLNFMKNEFSDSVFPINLDDFIELIRLCVCEAKFSFENEFFEQKFGLAMGNCLSPVCSNLYMEFFEKYLLRTILPDDVIWYRYVDDVLCLWPEDLDLDHFLCQLNNLVPSIEFSIEEEIDFKIPFLDVLIERVEHNFKFTIYRKPTNICSYIHYYSSHALSIKLAKFSGMFLKALKICSDDYLLEEIEFIFSIGRLVKRK